METNEFENETKAKPTVKGVFKNRDFARLWIGQFISNLGSNLTFIVLPLFIYYYTGSFNWLAIIAAAQIIPVILFSPFAGVFVDIHNRKPIMIISDLSNAILILLVPVLILLDTTYPKEYILTGVAIVVFLGAAVNRYFMPAREASIPHIVQGEEVNIAVSISQTTMQIIMVIGPVIGAAIATFFNFSAVFILDGFSFFFSALMILSIRADLRPIESSKTKQQRPSILLGTKNVFQIKTLRFLIIILAFLMIANTSLNTFLVAFEETNLHMSPVQFGTSVSILGGSAVLTGLLLTSKITKVKRPLSLVAWAFFIGGIILLPIYIIANYWQMYLILLLMGPVNIFVNIPTDIIFFRDTSDEIRGQVFSALNMLMSLFMIVGIAYGAINAPIIGLRLLFFVNALIFVIIGFIALFYLFFINNLDNFEQPIQNIAKSPVIPGD